MIKEFCQFFTGMWLLLACQRRFCMEISLKTILKPKVETWYGLIKALSLQVMEIGMLRQRATVSRFKHWLTRFNGVASKYLPNHRAWRRRLETGEIPFAAMPC